MCPRSQPHVLELDNLSEPEEMVTPAKSCALGSVCSPGASMASANASPPAFTLSPASTMPSTHGGGGGGTYSAPASPAPAPRRELGPWEETTGGAPAMTRYEMRQFCVCLDLAYIQIRSDKSGRKSFLIIVPSYIQKSEI